MEPQTRRIRADEAGEFNSKGFDMLVIQRKIGTTFTVGEATITIIDVRGKDHDNVRIGIEAPKAIPVKRAELLTPAEAFQIEINAKQG